MKFLNALKAALAKYPAVTAAALQIGAALAAKFGFHLTTAELAYFVSFLIALASPFVNAGYVHKAKNGNLA